MYLQERLQFILDELEKNGRVEVAELSEKLDISEVTVRKYLRELESENKLKRTFGGAISVSKHITNQNVYKKKSENIDEKKFICSLADKYLEDGIDIFLDAGTTCEFLIEYIAKYKNINVITYDLGIAYKLSNYPHISTYLLGGYVDSIKKCSISIDGYEAIDNFRTDICFIGTDAFDTKYVYSTNNLQSRIKKKMLVNSKTRILLADSSKFQKDGLISFFSLKDFDYIITDYSNPKLNKFLTQEN